jgi:tetratricopeptide (TPR) repeat protein
LVAGLVLEPVDVVGPGQWRWLLRTEAGEQLASHEVRLPQPSEAPHEHRGFTDLHQLLRSESDGQTASEAELTDRVGAWIGQEVLGGSVMKALLDAAPVTVRMPVPNSLGFLPYRPWRIAGWEGRVLGREDVNFVFDLEDTSGQHGAPPVRFLQPDQTVLDADQLLVALDDWARSTTGALPGTSLLLLQMLVASEPDDRTSRVLEHKWADLWNRLGRAGEAPALADALAPLIDAALIQPQPVGDSEAANQPVSYAIHPAVGDSIRAATPREVLDAVDAELAGYWSSIAYQARQQEQQQAGWLVVHAALAAAPYLLRHHDWNTAGELLEQALIQNDSRTVVAAVLPHLQRIAAGTAGTDSELADRARLARAFQTVDPQQSEQQLRDLLAKATEQQHYAAGSAIAGRIVSLLQATGRSAEALEVADQMAELSRQAGLGPWTQLAEAGWRVQVLAQTGEPEQVLTEFRELHQRMQTLPDEAGENESIPPFVVRETILDLGRKAVRELGHDQEAIDLNAEIVAAKQARGAGQRELAGHRFNDYPPLLRLGRLDEADQLLQDCAGVFEQAEDAAMVGRVLSARAEVAAAAGSWEPAVNLEAAALRSAYVGPTPNDVAASHTTLSGYLEQVGEGDDVSVPHLLAGTLIYASIGQTDNLQANGRELARLLKDPAGDVPSTVDAIRRQVEEVEGVRFGALIDALEPVPARQQAALDAILGAARGTPADVDRYLESWEPVLARAVAAADGDAEAEQQVSGLLDEMAGNEQWVSLAGVLRRILAGERDPELADGLDPVDTAIVSRLLDALAGRIQLHPPAPGATAERAEQPRDQWESFLAAIVDAAGGDVAAEQQASGLLDEMDENEQLAGLAGVLRRILAGERDPALGAELDPVGVAIVNRLLDALAGRIQLDPYGAGGADDEREEIREQWGAVISAMLKAADGDADAEQQAARLLDSFADRPNWVELVGVSRRILAGERDAESLLAGLNPVDTAIASQLLDAVAGRAYVNPPLPDEASLQQQVMDQWEPVLIAIVLAAEGDTDSEQRVTEVLNGVGDSPDWVGLVEVLRRILAGERDRDMLLTGLDAVDSAIITRLLDALAGDLQIVAPDDAAVEAPNPS